MPIPVVYRGIYRLPVAFDKRAVGIAYIITLDRHCVWLAGFRNDPK
jgi:hypothetical protein